MSAANTTPKADFSLADGQGYALERGHVSACRLNLQHYLWKDSIKYLLHPSIPTAGDVTVADIATGTAIWLTELARELPNATLDGLDIDVGQAPHSAWLPSNLRILPWDMFGPVPSELENRYDVIHIRLVVLAVDNGDPARIIENVYKMLKPGGYLQWDELSCVGLRVKKADEALPTPGLDRLLDMCYSNGRHNWTVEVPRFLTAQGFEDAQQYWFDDKTDMIRAMNEQHLLTMEEFGISLMRAGKRDAAASFFDVIKQAYAESTQGAALFIPRFIVVAKKPSM